jgi:hypothetical protein
MRRQSATTITPIRALTNRIISGSMMVDRPSTSLMNSSSLYFAMSDHYAG